MTDRIITRQRPTTACCLWIAVLVVLLGSLAPRTRAQNATSIDDRDLRIRADEAFAERHDAKRMQEAIDLYEILASATDPTAAAEQILILNRLAQLCYETTTFSPGNPDVDRVWFERGKAYGVRSILLGAEFVRGNIIDEDLEAAVRCCSDPAALLWTANNWGGLCAMNPIEGLLHLSDVRALYERCLAVDETYWGASAHNALGAMLMVTPPALGGDADAAVAHLETALRIAPDYLVNRVVRAQYLGFSYNAFGRICGVRDRTFVETELNAVLDSSPDAWPFWNREAIKEAESLLLKLAELTT